MGKRVDLVGWQCMTLKDLAQQHIVVHRLCCNLGNLWKLELNEAVTF